MGELVGQRMTWCSVARSILMYHSPGTHLSLASRQQPVRGRQTAPSAASVRSVITHLTNAPRHHTNSNQRHTDQTDEWKPCHVYALLGIKAPAFGTSAHSAILVQHVRRVTRHATGPTFRQIQNAPWPHSNI